MPRRAAPSDARRRMISPHALSHVAAGARIRARGQDSHDVPKEATNQTSNPRTPKHPFPCPTMWRTEGHHAATEGERNEERTRASEGYPRRRHQTERSGERTQHGATDPQAPCRSLGAVSDDELRISLPPQARSVVVDQMVAQRQRHNMRAVVGLHLPADRAHVVFDRRLRNHQFVRDLLVRQPPNQQMQDLALTSSQLLKEHRAGVAAWARPRAAFASSVASLRVDERIALTRTSIEAPFRW